MLVTVGNITFDCVDALKLATFWSAVIERPVDRGASEWFASIGGADTARKTPAWYFEKVAEPKTAKNRMHLDLIASEPGAVDELVALGATIVGKHEVPGGSHRWTVMRDPEGNEFCISDKSFTGA